MSYRNQRKNVDQISASWPERITFLSSGSEMADVALETLTNIYGNYHPDETDVIVPLGGDGFMLDSMHRCLFRGVPLFGMNRGTVGFLMNVFSTEGLRERIRAAQHQVLNPLVMQAYCRDGEICESLAFNEVSLLRQSRQAAKLRLIINGRTRMEQLVCDGVIVATAAGSTAYNLSAHGPILPLGSSMLALTPISPFRPRRWRGAVLPDSAEIKIEILEYEKRPVSAVADQNEVRDVIAVEIAADDEHRVTTLFDPDHNLEERILAEQFSFG